MDMANFRFEEKVRYSFDGGQRSVYCEHRTHDYFVFKDGQRCRIYNGVNGESIKVGKAIVYARDLISRF